MRVAYADPPYPGQAKLYRNHPDYAGEVDHGELIGRLVVDYPDGWALSTSSNALKDVLALCPDGVRVAAWVKPFAAFYQNPAYAWEPVIFSGGRSRKGKGDRNEDHVRDWVAATPPVFRGMNTGVDGTKPREFCYWLFNLMGLRAGDEFDDLFPGSGAVTECWKAWISQLRLVA